MTKADLIEEVSRVVEMTRKESEVIVEAIFDSIVRSLRTGDKIEIRGFGSFRTRQRQPRIGRNPKTGARVEVPAKKIPYFKPSKELKDVVNARRWRGPGATTGAQPVGRRAAPHGLSVDSLALPLHHGSAGGGGCVRVLPGRQFGG
jgi:integration host factor subunit beta